MQDELWGLIERGLTLGRAATKAGGWKDAVEEIDAALAALATLRDQAGKQDGREEYYRTVAKACGWSPVESARRPWEAIEQRIAALSQKHLDLEKDWRVVNQQYNELHKDHLALTQERDEVEARATEWAGIAGTANGSVVLLEDRVAQLEGALGSLSEAVGTIAAFGWSMQRAADLREANVVARAALSPAPAEQPKAQVEQSAACAEGDCLGCNWQHICGCKCHAAETDAPAEPTPQPEAHSKLCRCLACMTPRPESAQQMAEAERLRSQQPEALVGVFAIPGMMPVDPALLVAYETEMRERTIPAIVEAMHRRAESAANYGHCIPPKAPLTPSERAEVVLEDRVAEWVTTRIGADHMNSGERAMRNLEESAELAQAEGITKDQVIKQVEHVYSRPAGEPAQEAAGVAVCLLGWCAATGNRLMTLALAEIERIEAKPIEQIRASLKRKADADLVTIAAEAPPDPPITDEQVWAKMGAIKIRDEAEARRIEAQLAPLQAELAKWKREELK